MIFMKKLFIFLLFLPLFLRAEFAVKSYQELRNQHLVRQNYELSCGAASLATLLNMVDFRRFSELDILERLSEKELYTDMTSFRDLARVLDGLGYENRAYQMRKDSLDRLTGVPMLVKIEDDPRFAHFVVIVNYEGDFLQIFDPSFGAYTSSKREFFSLWDRDEKGGFVLMVLPKLANLAESATSNTTLQSENLESSNASKSDNESILNVPQKLQMPEKLHFHFTPFRLF